MLQSTPQNAGTRKRSSSIRKLYLLNCKYATVASGERKRITTFDPSRGGIGIILNQARTILIIKHRHTIALNVSAVP